MLAKPCQSGKCKMCTANPWKAISKCGERPCVDQTQNQVLCAQTHMFPCCFPTLQAQRAYSLDPGML